MVLMEHEYDLKAPNTKWLPDLKPVHRNPEWKKRSDFHPGKSIFNYKMICFFFNCALTLMLIAFHF